MVRQVPVPDERGGRRWIGRLGEQAAHSIGVVLVLGVVRLLDVGSLLSVNDVLDGALIVERTQHDHLVLHDDGTTANGASSSTKRPLSTISQNQNLNHVGRLDRHSEKGVVLERLLVRV
jgi:hypothetical protein